MCSTCGCESTEEISILLPGEVAKHDHHDHDHGLGHHHQHTHDHEHGYSHHHSHDSDTVTLNLEKDILYKNDLLAERNRGYFEARNIVALNLVSSPGSGKTTLLEATVNSMKDSAPLYIIEGDQQTMNDANRIAATGAPVVQVNTGKGCHLDSDMVHRSLSKLNPAQDSILFIENVGNLVCPSMFDLGETSRIVIMSVTEGEDKPLKYPTMFETSQICIVNKMDLLPYLNYDLEKAKKYALQVNPNLQFFEISATNGEGLEIWIKWLKEQVAYNKLVT
jgi:hydrogenase nickel incorporation protein HypB